MHDCNRQLPIAAHECIHWHQGQHVRAQNCYIPACSHWSPGLKRHHSEIPMLAATARALLHCNPTCTALPSLHQSVRSASLWGNTGQTQSFDDKARSPGYIHLKGLTFHGYHGVLPEVKQPCGMYKTVLQAPAFAPGCRRTCWGRSLLLMPHYL